MNKDHLKFKEYYVQGMHCAACEVLIEKEVLKQKGVEFADASLSNNKVSVYMQHGIKINLKKVNSKLRKLGYKLQETPIESDGGKGSKNIYKSLTIALLVVIAFYFFEKLQLGRYMSIDASSSYIAFFLLGLIASISSCAALIGGVVLSLGHSKVKPHLLFHLGRIISFIVLGGILGLLGSAVRFQGIGLTAFLVILVSIIMFILALQMLDVSWAQRIRLALPKSITGKIAGQSTSSFIIGALTFFLPCGFTLIAQGMALSSGDFVQAALIMLAFVLGTLPILLIISFTSVAMTKKPHLSMIFNQIVGIILIFFAVYNINSQFNVLGLPSLSDIQFNTGQSQNSLNEEVVFKYKPAPNEQMITLVARDFDYILQGDNTFEANKPTKLVVANDGAYGCAIALTVFGITDNYTLLEKGENVIDLGSPKSGTYKITCSMGMVAPVTIKFL